MRKFFAIFVAITLWNASALGVIALDPSDKLDPIAFCQEWTLDECNEEAQKKSTNTGTTYTCCRCTIPALGERVYNCKPEYIDLGYKLSGTVCVKDATTVEDEKGWTKTTYGNCAATVTYTAGESKSGYMLYQKGSNNSASTMMPVACLETTK